MSKTINVQRAILNEINSTLTSNSTNNFLESYLVRITQDEFVTQSKDPNNFWVINKITYTPVSYEWQEGNIVALDSIYDESGVINTRWAITADITLSSVLNDLDTFKRAIKGKQGQLFATEKKDGLGTKLSTNYTTSANLPDANTITVGTYAKVIGVLGNLDRIYEVQIAKYATDTLTEVREWVCTYQTEQEYEYENFVFSLNSNPYIISQGQFILNAKKVVIVDMVIPYRVHNGRNGSDNLFRIKPLTLNSDTRGDDDYIIIKHLTRSNGLGINTGGSQGISKPDAGVLNTMSLFGSDFLIYDEVNFLTNYLYDRIGRYKTNQETLGVEDTISTADPNKIFTIELQIGNRIYHRDVIIDAINLIDGIAERVMWSISFKEAKPAAVTKQKEG